jgi:hypothetical protein
MVFLEAAKMLQPEETSKSKMHLRAASASWAVSGTKIMELWAYSGKKL